MNDDRRGRCARCLLREGLCVCGELPRLESATRVVLVRHHLESFKSTNTGRLLSLVLANAELVDWGGPGAPRALEVPDDAALLFPADAPTIDRPGTLVVVDASWAQARRMTQRIERLRAMPRYALRLSGESWPSLRVPPREGMRSTIEAVARALGALESPELERMLRGVNDLFLERALAGRGLTRR